jgi:hypothetical protein
MMVSHPGNNLSELLDMFDDLRPHIGMALNGIVFLRAQLLGFPENTILDSDLPNIVKDRGDLQPFHVQGA